MTIRAKAAMAARVAQLSAVVLSERIAPTRPAPVGTVPRSLDTLSAPWLTDALCAGHPGAGVVGFEFADASAGTSARRALTVHYNEAGTRAGLPTRLFTKSTPDLKTKLFTGLTNLFVGEARYYTAIRPLLDIESPLGYHAGYHIGSCRSLIIMENVASTKGATFGDPTRTEIGPDQAEDMVRLMAGYHGTFWDDPRLRTEFSWLASSPDWQRHLDSMINTAAMVRRGITRAGSALPASLSRRAGDIWPAFQRSLELKDRPPLTLVHHDPHTLNWYRTAEGRMGLYDWQTLVKGIWAIDVSYALNAGLTIENRRAWLPGLLELYRERLRAAGVHPPDQPAAMLAYRQQTIHGLIFRLATLGRARCSRRCTAPTSASPTCGGSPRRPRTSTPWTHWPARSEPTRPAVCIDRSIARPEEPAVPDTVRDWVAQHAEVRPDSVALSSYDGGPTLNWGRLERRVAALAHQLRTRYRVGRGDRVSVLAENDPRMFELQFALWRLGAIFAPLNWRLAPAELRILCADCRPALLVHDRAWAVLGAELADHATGGARLAWGPVPGVDDYEVLISEASDGVAAGNRAGFEDIAQILYTSGTTGRPKGALISHGSIHWQAINLAHSSGVAEPGCHQYDPMPLFHAGGLNVLANPVLYWGGRVSAVARLVPSAMVAAMGDPGQRITHFASFPAICHQMAAEPGFRTADFSALRYLVLAAGTVSPELLAAWRSVGVRLQPQYGGTEMGPMALVLGRDELAAADRGSVGRPPMHTEVRLVDEHGVDVPDGTVGEIWLRGGSITSGYWGRPRSDHFTDDWFRTGDAARREPDGLYYIAGRTKDMYKSGGENVYPAEVEIALRDAPGVAEIVVVGVPDPRWDEVGLAAVVPVPGAEVTLAGLRDYGTERIARYKLPAHLVLLAEFPRNATGKVSRVELRDQFVRSSD